MVDQDRTAEAATEESVALFEQLFDELFDDVWRFARRRVGSSADADDVTSEVFAVLWRRREDLPPADERRPWLFGVAANVVRNHHRTTTRQHRVSSRLAQSVEGPGDGFVDPLRDERVWHALAALPPADRDLLLMRAWDQLPVTEMAAVLGCTPNAVSVRLSKARARLRGALAAKDVARAGDDVYDPPVGGDRDV